MNESGLQFPLNIGSVAVASDAKEGYVLTSNGDGTSSWLEPSGGGTYDAATNTGPYDLITVNATSGVITLPAASGTN